MELTFGEKIRDSRKAKGFTQKELAEKIGAKHNSISDWENNKNKPDPDTIELLCGVLDITPNYLLTQSSSDFSPIEKLIIKKYRNLDEIGKEHVNTILDWETERISKASAAPKIITAPTRTISYYQRLASAGTGQVVFSDLPAERIAIPDIPEYCRVSYAIGVNGCSMEPLYDDGDLLLIEPTCEIDIGDVGIFIVGQEAFVKKLGRGELISLNQEYSNIPLTDGAKCMGRVVDNIRPNELVM